MEKNGLTYKKTILMSEYANDYSKFNKRMNRGDYIYLVDGLLQASDIQMKEILGNNYDVSETMGIVVIDCKGQKDLYLSKETITKIHEKHLSSTYNVKEIKGIVVIEQGDKYKNSINCLRVIGTELEGVINVSNDFGIQQLEIDRLTSDTSEKELLFKIVGLNITSICKITNIKNIDTIPKGQYECYIYNVSKINRICNNGVFIKNTYENNEGKREIFIGYVGCASIKTEGIDNVHIGTINNVLRGSIEIDDRLESNIDISELKADKYEIKKFTDLYIGKCNVKELTLYSKHIEVIKKIKMVIESDTVIKIKVDEGRLTFDRWLDIKINADYKYYEKIGKAVNDILDITTVGNVNVVVQIKVGVSGNVFKEEYDITNYINIKVK